MESSHRLQASTKNSFLHQVSHCFGSAWGMGTAWIYDRVHRVGVRSAAAITSVAVLPLLGRDFMQLCSRYQERMEERQPHIQVPLEDLYEHQQDQEALVLEESSRADHLTLEGREVAQTFNVHGKITLVVDVIFTATVLITSILPSTTQAFNACPGLKYTSVALVALTTLGFHLYGLYLYSQATRENIDGENRVQIDGENRVQIISCLDRIGQCMRRIKQHLCQRSAYQEIA